MEELIRAAAEQETVEQTDTVLAMLQARIGRFDSWSRRTLEAASVFGQTFWRGGLLALFQHAEDAERVDAALEVLVQAEVVKRHQRSRFGNEVEYGFRHALVRDAAYALLARSEQELGNRLACTYLEQIGERDPMVLAEHAHAGRELARAAIFYKRAAEESQKRFDLAGMAERVELAIRCGARDEALGELLSIKLEVCFWRQEFQAAREIWADALMLMTPGSRSFCKALGLLISMSSQMADPALMQRATSELMLHTPAADALLPYYEAVSQIVLGASLMGVRELLQPFCERLAMLDRATLAREPLVRGHVNFALYARWYFADYGPYLEYLHALACVEAFDHSQAESWLNMGRIALACALDSLGEYELADRKMRQCLADALTRNALLEVLSARTQRLFMIADRRHPTELDEIIEHSRAIIQLNATEATVGSAHGSLARVYLAQGRLSEAAAAAEQALEILVGTRTCRPRVLRTLIEVRLQQGRIEEALKLAEEAQQHLQIHGAAGRWEVALRVAIVEAQRAADQRDAARVSLQQALALIDRHAEQIPDPAVRQRYRNEVDEHVHAQALAADLIAT